VAADYIDAARSIVALFNEAKTELETEPSSGGTIPVFSNTLYVDPNTSATTHDGSLSNPFLTIQDAIDSVADPLAAQTSVVLAPGIFGYTESPAFPDGYWALRCDEWNSGYVTGTISFTASNDSSFLDLYNLVIFGNVTGAADAGVSGVMVLYNCYVSGGLTGSGPGDWTVFVQGTLSTFAPTVIKIEGVINISGALQVENVRLSNTVTVTGNLYCNACALVNATSYNVGGTVAEYNNCDVYAVITTTFTGAAGELLVDGYTAYQLDRTGGLLVNGTRTVADRFNKFIDLSISGALSNNVAQAAIWSAPNPTPAGLYMASGQIVKSVGGTARNINLQIDQITDELGANTLVVAVIPVAGTGRNSFDLTGQGVVFWHNGSTQLRIGVAGIVTPGALQFFARCHLVKLN